MALSPTANCTPRMLAWAREDQGYPLERAAEKLKLSPERLASWEQGDAQPSIAQLRKVAALYRRPLALFFLPEPPEEFQTLSDFRRMPDADDMRWSPELRALVQRVRGQQRTYVRLLATLGEHLPVLPTASSTDDPEQVGAFARSLLAVTSEDQHRWKDRYSALSGWSKRVEDHGVLVLHTSTARGAGVPLDEMLGFSELDLVPTIVLNGTDGARRRTFTLLHEFAHLLLRNAGVCDLHDRTGSFDPTEVFCNAVAAATLMPREEFLADPAVRNHTVGTPWTNDTLGQIGERFTASNEAVLRRLLTFQLTTEQFYRQWRVEDAQRRREAADNTPKPTGGPSYYPMKVRELGAPYVAVVIDAYHQDAINASDVAGYLNIKIKNLPGIEEAVAKKLAQAG